MARTSAEIKIFTNADDVARLIERIQAHLDAAPDDDPVKMALADFGEIDVEKHLPMVSDCADGVISVRVTPIPELQRIIDMVP